MCNETPGPGRVTGIASHGPPEGCAVDAVKEYVVNAVLGLSVTPSAIGVAVLDGSVDGRETWEIRPTSAERNPIEAVAAVRRAEQLLAGRGRRVRSINVTWSDEARADAAALVDTLAESCLVNIVEVRLPAATDALAREVAHDAGYSTTAVCLVEPGQLVALVVNSADGAVQTAVNHSAVTEDDLSDWLSIVFTKADRTPDALVLVGSAEDLDGLAPALQDALRIPVLVPAEAALALARGAALAGAPATDLGMWDQLDPGEAGRSTRRSRSLHPATPAAMLAAGTVAFVASASAALALQFTATDAASAEAIRPSAQTSAALTGAAPVKRPPVTAPAPQMRPPSSGEAVDSAPIAEAAPIVEAAGQIGEAAAPIGEAPPAVEPAPAPGSAPGSESAPVFEAAPVELPVAQPPAEPPLAPVPSATPPEMIPPPVPEQEPGLMQRIRDRLAGIGNDDAAPPPPAPVPAPPGAPPPPQ